MHDVFLCPSCARPLEQLQMEHGVFWACRQCGGRALSVELLRRTFTKESVNPVWLRVLSGAGRPGRNCPCCGRPMTEVALADQTEAPLVDVCRTCHFAWFDLSEIGQLQPLATPAEPPAESGAVRKSRSQSVLSAHSLADPPLHEWWQQLVQFLTQWVG